MMSNQAKIRMSLPRYASMVELVDALVLGTSDRKVVQVRLLLDALNNTKAHVTQ